MAAVPLRGDDATAGWRCTLQLPWREASVSLDSAHRRIALCGPSGAGKSTVLRAIAGGVEVRGRVKVAGRLLSDSEQRLCVPAWQRGVAWAPQDALLLPHLSVRENLLAASDALSERLAEVAALLELERLLARRPSTLSTGERARVALGRAIIRRCETWLLDEPLAALDPPLRRRIGDVLRDEAIRTGRHVLLVTHDRSEAERLCDQVWTLDGEGLRPA